MAHRGVSDALVQIPGQDEDIVEEGVVVGDPIAWNLHDETARDYRKPFKGSQSCLTLKCDVRSS